MACQYCMTSAVGRCQYCGPQGAATVAHDWDQLQRRYSSAERIGLHELDKIR